jgi:hypothetical protein
MNNFFTAIPSTSQTSFVVRKQGTFKTQVCTLNFSKWKLDPDNRIFPENKDLFFYKFVCVGRVPDPTSHFPPDLILDVNLVTMGTT